MTSMFLMTSLNDLLFTSRFARLPFPPKIWFFKLSTAFAPPCYPSSTPNRPHARLNCDPQLRHHQNSSILTISWNKSSILMHNEIPKDQILSHLALCHAHRRANVTKSAHQTSPVIHLSSFKYPQSKSVNLNITKA